jgi:Tol biopolymer transport system component
VRTVPEPEAAQACLAARADDEVSQPRLRKGANRLGRFKIETTLERRVRVRSDVLRSLRFVVLAVVALALTSGTASAASDRGTHASLAGRIVFARDVGPHSELYVATTQGRILRRLTRNGSSDYTPRWSPNGRRIVFVSDRDGDDEVYVMDADGSDVRQLTRNRCPDFAPAWSPDGRRIAFAHARACALPPEIYVIQANGRHARRLTRTRRWVVNTSPAWSPDGRLILFARTGGDLLRLIYVMRADGRHVRRLTRKPVDAGMPAWSPDGRLIAFVSLRSRSNDIYVMNSDGIRVRRLTNNIRDDFVPRFSPTGKRLIFTRLRLPDGKTVDEIFTIDTDGKHERRVTSGFDPDWRA